VKRADRSAARGQSRFDARTAEAARTGPRDDRRMQTLTNESRWFRAVLERDTNFDGRFFFAVRTTGVFCRPGCSARTPKRENVCFFASTDEALAAGFRACKRCTPLALQGAVPDDVRALIDEVKKGASRITDADLVSRGLDPSTVRRRFQTAVGQTFHAFQRATRLGRAAAALQSGADVLSGAAAAGYASTSGFYDAFAAHFGTTPAGRSPQLFGELVETPLGAMLAVASDEGLCLLEFTDRKALATELADLRKRFDSAIAFAPHPFTSQVARELAEYFEKSRTSFDVPLAPCGTPFQRAVWDALLAIPHGRTATYAEQAARLGRASAVRAVATANGANRLAIVIPCHRVIGSDGSLTGYAGGLWRKRRLLDHER
jgi:AraC family transcriptional regulator, regulatory protein of adaptative response / methylated-DNA-[protein]-cysteine methyltransferase